MSNITTELIKELRDKTGVSVMQCKKALESVNGNIDEALDVLKKESRNIASKKSERRIGAGVVSSYIHATGTVGAMIELVCETDFVARNEEFKELAYNIAMHIAAMDPEKKEDLVEQEFIKDSKITIKGLIESATQKFGERIEIDKFIRFSI